MCVSLPTIRGLHFTDLVRCMQSMFVSNFVIFQLTISEKHSIWLEPHGLSTLDFSVYHIAKSFKPSRIKIFASLEVTADLPAFVAVFCCCLELSEEIRIILRKEVLQYRFWLWEFRNIGDFANYFLWDQTKCRYFEFHFIFRTIWKQSCLNVSAWVKFSPVLHYEVQHV